jgi:tetratricopeptide (TPR) repeat protein
MNEEKAKSGSSRLRIFVETHEKPIVAGIFLVAISLRLAHLVEIKLNDPFFTLPSVDPAMYHDWAIAIGKGDALGDKIFFLSPLYPYFLGLIYFLTGPGFVVPRIIQMLLGASGSTLVYLIGKRIFNIETGMFSGIIFATFETFIFYEGILLITDIQTPLNLVLALSLLKCQDSPTPAKWSQAGACLGLSALARPNVLILGIFVLVWIGVAFRERLNTKRLLSAGLFFIAGTALVVLPVTVRNYAVGDDLVLISSQGGANFYIGNGPDADGGFMIPPIFPQGVTLNPIDQQEQYREYAEKESGESLKPSQVSAFWYSKTFGGIKAKPGRWAGLLLKKLGLFINKVELDNVRDITASRDFSAVMRLGLPSFGFVAPFGLLGMVLALSRIRKAFVLYAMVVTYAVSTALFFSLARYRLPAAPFLIVFAGYAIHRLIDAALTNKAKHLLQFALVLAASFWLVNLHLFETSGLVAIAHYNAGNKYRQLNDRARAMEQYELAIEGNGSFLPAYNNLALLSEQAPRLHDKAKDTWKKLHKAAGKAGNRRFMEAAERHLKKLDETASTTF